MGRPPKNAFGEQTSTRILRAAEDAFGAHGFRQARLADIAEKAGIRRSSLLYHFGSKDHLYAEVVERAFAQLEETIGAAITEGPTEPELAINYLVDTLVAFAKSRSPVVRVMLREMVDPSGEGEVLIAFGRLIRALERAFRSVAGDRISPDFPVQAAIMQLVSAYFLRNSVGPLGRELWGRGDHTHQLTQMMMLGTYRSEGVEKANDAQ